MFLPEGDIERGSAIPYYFQLMRLLENEIARGTWPVGERIPPENVLCQHFGISRSTVRQALSEIERKSLIRKEKGQGSFVTQTKPVSWSLDSSHGLFQEESLHKGRAVKSKVLRAEINKLPSWAAMALGLEASDESEGIKVERLRWVDGYLINYAINYLPTFLASTVLSADLESGSLYEALEKQEGLKVCGIRRVLEAVPAEGALVECLQVEPHSPLLLVESISWDQDYRPIDCCRVWQDTVQMKIDIRMNYEFGNLQRHSKKIQGIV